MNRRALLQATAALSAVGTAPALFTPALAKAPIRKTQAPGYYRMALGGFEITALSDGTIKLPMADLYRGMSSEDITEYLANHFQDVPTETSVNAYLVNTGERLVLVDAGSNDLMGPRLGKLRENLDASGVAPDQIDDVILTHIHPDHSGGLIFDGQMAFPNAVVHVNEREARFWLEREAAGDVDDELAQMLEQAEACLGPYVRADRFRTFADNASPLPGFGSTLRAGHTPGHSSIIAESSGQKIVFWGDIVHGDFLQYDHPEISFAADLDQDEARQARSAAFAEAADTGYLVAGAHHAFPGIGRVKRDATNYDWLAIPYSAEL